MRTFITTLSILAAAFLPVACTVEAEVEATSTTNSEVSTDPIADVVADIHRVECGCALDEVGHCGNYIEIDGAFVEVAGDLGLGEMEWCGQNGLSAKSSGEMKDGKFVATSLTVVP